MANESKGFTLSGIGIFITYLVCMWMLAMVRDVQKTQTKILEKLDQCAMVQVVTNTPVSVITPVTNQTVIVDPGVVQETLLDMNEAGVLGPIIEQYIGGASNVTGRTKR